MYENIVSKRAVVLLFWTVTFVSVAHGFRITSLQDVESRRLKQKWLCRPKL